MVARIVDSEQGLLRRTDGREGGRKTASQGHKIMIDGVDENGGGSDGQRVARVETSLDSLPRYPQGRPHCNQGHKCIIPLHGMEFVHLLALPPRQGYCVCSDSL